MEEKTLEGFEKVIEREIESTFYIITNTNWDMTSEEDKKTLINTNYTYQVLKKTLNYIKQYRRDLI